MNKWLEPRRIILYACLFAGFYFTFESIPRFYIKDTTITPHAVDIHVAKTFRFFHTAYVHAAKNGGYDIEGYARSFFLVDMFFPVVYSLLFLSILLWARGVDVYHRTKGIVLAAALFDYLENFSLLSYLHLPGGGLAAAVSIFSTIKSVLFGGLVLTCGFFLFRRLYLSVNKQGHTD